MLENGTACYRVIHTLTACYDEIAWDPRSSYDGKKVLILAQDRSFAVTVGELSIVGLLHRLTFSVIPMFIRK